MSTDIPTPMADELRSAFEQKACGMAYIFSQIQVLERALHAEREKSFPSAPRRMDGEGGRKR